MRLNMSLVEVFFKEIDIFLSLNTLTFVYLDIIFITVIQNLILVLLSDYHLFKYYL